MSNLTVDFTELTIRQTAGTYTGTVTFSCAGHKLSSGLEKEQLRGILINFAEQLIDDSVFGEHLLADALYRAEGRVKSG